MGLVGESPQGGRRFYANSEGAVLVAAYVSQVHGSGSNRSLMRLTTQGSAGSVRGSSGLVSRSLEDGLESVH